MQQSSRDKSEFDLLLKAAAEDSLVFLPNTTLMEGRFVVERQLGSGGMGIVYEAYDHKLATKVALKVLSDVNPAGIYRLKQEFRALADVSHPNLVSLHELFNDAGQWFFTMELIPGRNLLDYLLPEESLDDLKRTFLQLATGIKAIHDAGKLHRDLKPNNVLVTPAGQVKILDFGLVSDQEAGGVGQTIVDEGISGTPTYMSPEQASSLPAVPASDWYAFGVMLFEALTGKAPIEDTSKELIRRKRLEDPPPPRTIRSGVPKSLDELCRNLLKRDWNERAGFNDVAELFGNVSVTAQRAPFMDDHPFVGRDKEISLLEDAFQSTDNGTPVLVFVTGASGIGKTTLVERFLGKVAKERRAIVLKGRCYERESVPFKTCDSLIDELSRYIRRLPETRASRLMPRQISALAKIFPVLNRLDVVRQTRNRHPLPLDPNELRRVAFSAAKELMAYITSEDPLILYVDDLQWSDVDGIKLLAALVSNPDPPALMLIGAYRSEDRETSAGLSTLRSQLEEMEGRDIRTIDLNKLNDSDAHRLAKKLLVEKDRDFVRKIAKEGHGSPFIISELARFAQTNEEGGIQPSLERAIEVRISGLSSDDRMVIEMLSITSGPIEESLLTMAIGSPNLASTLRNLENLRLIRQTGGNTNKIGVYHDQIRAAVFSLLPSNKIVGYHQRIADALERSPAPDPVALTEHLLGADNPQKAGTYAAKAAHWAADILAFDNAARLYRIALEYNPGDRKNERVLQTALGEALSNAGYGPDAAEAYKKAADGAPDEEALELRRLAAQQWLNTGHMDEGLQELGSVLERVGLKLYGSTTGTLLSLILNRIALSVRGFRFETHPAVENERQALLKLRTCESIMQGLWAADVLQSAAFNARYLRLALNLGSVNDIVKSLSAEAIFRAMKSAEKKETTDKYLYLADKLSEQVTDPEILAFLRLARGLVFFFRSEFPDAGRHLRLAEQLCLESCTRKNMTMDIAQSVLGSIYVRIGNWGKLRTEWEVWYKKAKDYGNMYQLAMCQIWPMGCIRYLSEDKPERAEAQLNAGIKNWPFKKFNLPHMFALQSKVYIHLYRGEAEEACRIARSSLKQLKENRVAGVQTMRINSLIQLAQATLSLAARNRDSATIKQAMKLSKQLSRERCDYSHPFVLFIDGMAAHLTGDRNDAISNLSKAIEAFDKAQYKMNSATVKFQLAGMLGGERGDKLMATAIQQMSEEGIANPAKVATMLAPGYLAG